MVTLKRAVAVAMVDGPEAGLELVNGLAADDPMAATTAFTRCAPTCSSSSAIPARPERPTEPPPATPPTSRRSGTSKAAPPTSPPPATHRRSFSRGRDVEDPRSTPILRVTGRHRGNSTNKGASRDERNESDDPPLGSHRPVADLVGSHARVACRCRGKRRRGCGHGATRDRRPSRRCGHAGRQPRAHTAATVVVFGFALPTLMCAAIGTGLAVALARRAKRPAHTFTVVTTVLSALSLISPVFAGATAPATKTTLVAAHLLAAAIVIPTLARRLARSGHQAGRGTLTLNGRSPSPPRHRVKAVC
jgi:Family of unknown function (DUF6069)